MTLQTKITWVLGGLLLVATAVAGIFIHKYLVSQQNAENQAAIITQNEAAYQQQLTQKADSIQMLAVAIGNLNVGLTQAQKRAGKWQAIAQSLQIEIDSLDNSGSGVASTGVDSLGQYGDVLFGPDTRGIATISGWTRYYFTNPVITKYLWDAAFAPIPISNSLYQDSDGLWKIRTETKAPGVKFTSNSVIDSTIYIGLRQTVEGALAKSKHYLPSFGLRLKAGIGLKSTLQLVQGSNIGFPSNTLIFDGSIEAYYTNYSITYYPTWGLFSAGLNYTLDVSSIIEDIL